MKQIILVFVALFFLTKTNAQTCGSPVAGPIIQKVTHKSEYVNGLFWSPERLLYVDKNYPRICRLSTNGDNMCTKLQEIKQIISVYPVKKDPKRWIIFTDKLEILLYSNTSSDGLPTGNITMETIKIITTLPPINLVQTVTDDKGRTLIAANLNFIGRLVSKVYMLDADGTLSELIKEYQIVQNAGIILSSDYKFLFVADGEKNLIYKYEYNDRKGSVGTPEVVFNKTEHEEYSGHISAIGLTKTSELWIATNNSGVINLYDWKNKKFLQNVKIATNHPTSMCYGGEKLNVLFVGTRKSYGMEAKEDQGGGAVYAISGTGTVGFAQNMLEAPKEAPKDAPKSQFKNAYYMGPEELEKLAAIDENLVAT